MTQDQDKNKTGRDRDDQTKREQELAAQQEGINKANQENSSQGQQNAGGGAMMMAMFAAGHGGSARGVQDEGVRESLANLGDALDERPPVGAGGHGFSQDERSEDKSPSTEQASPSAQSGTAPRPVPVPKQQVLEAIAKASDQLGVPLDTSLRIIRIESNFRADAANPRSSAKGLSQAIDSTAASEWSKLRQEFGDKIPELSQKYNPFDPYHSALVGIHYARDNMNALSGHTKKMEGLLGHDPKNASVYLSHFLGPGGAKKMLSNGFDKQAGSVLSNNVMKANPHLNGMTVGGVVKWADKKMNEADMSNLIAAARNKPKETVSASAEKQNAPKPVPDKPHKRDVASLKVGGPADKAADKAAPLQQAGDLTKAPKVGQVGQQGGAAGNDLFGTLTA